MGTSKGYGGAPSGLVPSWIDDTAPGAAGPPLAAPGAPSGGNDGAPSPQPAVPAAAPDTSSAGGLGAAKGNFTRFVRSGDSETLRRAVSQYVRNGTGSAGKAARRMGASRGVGKQLLQVIRDINRDGAATVLQRLNLGHLAGRPAAEVFVELLESMCPPGGRVDEAIARQALLDAIADLAESDAGNFEELTAGQLSEFFQGFIIHTIEGRVIADIGKHVIDSPENVAQVESILDQLHDFVVGCVHGHLGQHFDGLAEKTDQQVANVVESIYHASFELVSATAGDVQ